MDIRPVLFLQMPDFRQKLLCGDPVLTESRQKGTVREDGFGISPGQNVPDRIRSDYEIVMVLGILLRYKYTRKVPHGRHLME